MLFFFFNDTATTEIYTLSLHDALPICSFLHCGQTRESAETQSSDGDCIAGDRSRQRESGPARSEEHTSELQSRQYLVCRLLLEKKKKQRHLTITGRQSRSHPTTIHTCQ